MFYCHYKGPPLRSQAIDDSTCLRPGITSAPLPSDKVSKIKEKSPLKKKKLKHPVIGQKQKDIQTNKTKHGNTLR